MKLEFKAKYLQYLLTKNKNQGFSWVDLLVSIIILGILAAITLPGLLSQIHKSKQSEAKNNIGAMNRAQQAYFLEHKKLTTDFAQLRLGIKTETTNYRYRVELHSQNRQVEKFNGNVIPSQNYVMNIAQAKKPQLISIVGIVGTIAITGSTTSELLTVAFACRSDEPTTLPPPPLVPRAGYEGYLECPEGYHDLWCKGKVK